MMVNYMSNIFIIKKIIIFIISKNKFFIINLFLKEKDNFFEKIKQKYIVYFITISLLQDNLII